MCRTHEFYFDDGPASKATSGATLKFHVLISSYEIVLADDKLLGRVDWEALIIDEGHRLKSKSSKLFQTLQKFRTRFRLLLTGTPLQNNLEELWTLLHFLQPEKFVDLDSFQTRFEGQLDKEEQVPHCSLPHTTLTHADLTATRDDGATHALTTPHYTYSCRSHGYTG